MAIFVERICMQVVTRIGKLDIIKLNILGFFDIRRPSSITIIGPSIMFFSMVYYYGWPKNFYAFIYYAVISFIYALFYFRTLNIVFAMIRLLFMSSKNSILAEHTYTLLPEGFSEKTTIGESVLKWHAVRRVKKIGSYLEIEMDSFSTCFIPKKSFDSLEQFEAFKLQAMVYWQEAKKD
jgi:hypothetical protein